MELCFCASESPWDAHITQAYHTSGVASLILPVSHIYMLGKAKEKIESVLNKRLSFIWICELFRFEMTTKHVRVVNVQVVNGEEVSVNRFCSLLT